MTGGSKAHEDRSPAPLCPSACRDEARAHGIDLDDFGTTATAKDFERVHQALGIARWNVVGESYGTTIAMTLMARHPETIRSAVLDPVYPPDPLPCGRPGWPKPARLSSRCASVM